MAAQRNVSVDQGSNLTLNFPITNTDNSPFDLTGWTARAQVRATYGASQELIDASTTNGKLAIAGNVVTWQIVAADTAAERFSATDDASVDCVYDLKIIAPNGAPYTPVGGTFTVNRAVTR